MVSSVSVCAVKKRLRVSWLGQFGCSGSERKSETLNSEMSPSWDYNQQSADSSLACVILKCFNTLRQSCSTEQIPNLLTEYTWKQRCHVGLCLTWKLPPNRRISPGSTTHLPVNLKPEKPSMGRGAVNDYSKFKYMFEYILKNGKITSAAALRVGARHDGSGTSHRSCTCTASLTAESETR